ncbi:MAG TPA: TIR domain-containing protein, partial [Polyangia bacterium]|nr:TIR domain-containing protein [Polyangia bacterium]
MTDPRYDVFFSYHSADHVEVERVARGLAARGLRVFLDRWYLTAGQAWPEALERALAECAAVMVFVGPSGVGAWQQREQALALDRQARQGGFPVIPVLLPGADPPLGFLGLNTWIDLRGQPADESALAVLEASVRGQPPGPEAQSRMQQARATLCPYRGLHAFREEDAAFFFGREAFVEKLRAAIASRALVAVVGASGSGKSSVVRAGLAPALRSPQGGTVWDIVTLVPTDRPLHALAAALVPRL